MFCGSCGTKIGDGDCFCTVCGRMAFSSPPTEPSGPSESFRPVAQAENTAKETSEITGKKAVVFLAVMVLTALVGITLSPNPEVTRYLLGVFFFVSVAAWAVSKLLPDEWLNFGETVALGIVLSLVILVCVFGTFSLVERNVETSRLMPYLFSWLFQALLIIVLVGSARSSRHRCEWNRDFARSRLTWGIVTVAIVQSAQFYLEETSGHGLGILYHIQWIGVFWIARAIFRLQDLRKEPVAAPKAA